VLIRPATHIEAVAVTVPDVAVNVIAPVPVASTRILAVPVAVTAYVRVLTGNPDESRMCPPAPAVTVTDAPVAETPADVKPVKRSAISSLVVFASDAAHCSFEMLRASSMMNGVVPVA
jgi:hypothetical protein